MHKSSALICAIAAVLIAGCQSQAQILANEQTTAAELATRRGQFEMNCPQAKGMVLSSTMLQPVVWGGMERAEYTVGVDGCGQRKIYVVICQAGSSNCFAARGAS
jgi:hypothetical protein